MRRWVQNLQGFKMKKTILCISLLTAITQADEIERINALAKEVQNLRQNYEICRQKLNTSSKSTQKPSNKKQKEKIEALQEELATYKAKLRSYKGDVEDLRLENETLKAKIDAKNKEIEALKEKSAKNTPVTDEQKQTACSKDEKVAITKPKTFRTNKEAPIYDAKNGKIIDTWEKRRSFTSYIESGDWIKITGYFVDRKWRKAKKELWIKKEDAIVRN